MDDLYRNKYTYDIRDGASANAGVLGCAPREKLDARPFRSASTSPVLLGLLFSLWWFRCADRAFDAHRGDPEHVHLGGRMSPLPAHAVQELDVCGCIRDKHRVQRPLAPHLIAASLLRCEELQPRLLDQLEFLRFGRREQLAQGVAQPLDEGVAPAGGPAVAERAVEHLDVVEAAHPHA
eukprot:scaffold4174_cov122-Isochrysis_galbana.AAC.2